MTSRQQEGPIWRPWVELAEQPQTPLKDLGPQILDTLDEQLLMDQEWVDREERKLTWWGGPLPLEFHVSEPRLGMGDPVVKVTADVRIFDDIGTSSFEDACLLISTINGMNGGGMMWIDPNDRSVHSTVTHYAHEGNAGIIETKVFAMLAIFNYGSALAKAPRLEEMFETKAEPPAHPTSGPRADYDELTNYPAVAASESQVNNYWAQLGVEDSISNFRQQGLVSEGDRNTVTVEFPYTTSITAMEQ